jgi:hypothetical protein
MLTLQLLLQLLLNLLLLWLRIGVLLLWLLLLVRLPLRWRLALLHGFRTSTLSKPKEMDLFIQGVGTEASLLE